MKKVLTKCLNILTGILIIALISISYPQKGFAETSEKKASASSQKANSVSYPVSDFKDGKAKFYIYENNGIKIKYFILKSSDGIIRAAFDACDVCFKHKEGYFQEKDLMVCRRCGQKFPSNKINEIKGGCNPAPLNRSIEGNKVIINKNDILEGEFYFSR